LRPILEVVTEVHDALDTAGLRHAFGGAFALLWCTGEPRATVDIDINVFARPSEALYVVDSLPDGVDASAKDIDVFAHDGQVRLFLDGIPLDLFLSTSDFHGDVQIRSTTHDLAGRTLPFLSCNDLAVFKAFFNRRKDWADIEEMLRAGRIDFAYVAGTLARYLGPDDGRIAELDQVRREVFAGAGEP